MLLVWKNKGLLVLLYLLVCLLGTAMLLGILKRNVGGLFLQIDFYTTIGLAFLFASAWTYLTKDDYYKDNSGNKVKMDTVNELFWMSMKTWAIIFLIAAMLFLGNLLFGYFETVNNSST